MGFHQLHPILKLADGTWLVGEYKESWTPDWHEGEFWPAYVRWRKLDVNKMVEVATGNRYENGRWEENRLEQSGRDRLQRHDGGSGHGSGGWSRIDWIEVYRAREALTAGRALGCVVGLGSSPASRFASSGRPSFFFRRARASPRAHIARLPAAPAPESLA
jgi:hypothetical protein